MPRLLLISFHFPPRLNSGAIRPAALAKHLPQFGWEVLVLTPKQLNTGGSRPAVKTIETNYEDVLEVWKRRLGMDPQRALHDQLSLSMASNPKRPRLHTRAIDFLRQAIAFPDEHKGWVPHAVEALSRLRNQSVDAIVSTSPPPTCHIIAAEARRILSCPWLADFRDLWAHQNFFDARRYLRPFHVRLEKRTLRAADALVTVSEPWADRLRCAYPEKPVRVITNGFDPEDFPTTPPPLTPLFTLSHAGFLYEGKRDPSLLFGVLRDLAGESLIDRRQVRVRFYGQPEFWLSNLARHYQVEDMVEIGGRIPRAEAIKREMESQMLLLLGWSDPREVGQHTGKLFEYFGAGRPILAAGGAEGVLSATLAETRTGVHARNKEQLRSALLQAYQEFQRQGVVAYHPDRAAVNKYTHAQMAKQFAQLLDQTLAAGRGCAAQTAPHECPALTQ